MTDPQTQTITIQRTHQNSLELPLYSEVREGIEGDADSVTGLPYLGALVNNDVCSLDYPLSMNCDVEPITFENRHGIRIYRRTLAFLLSKAVTRCFPEARFSLEHSLGDAYYCSFQINGNPGIRQSELTSIESRLRKVIADNLPIRRRSISYADAKQRLLDQGFTDKLNLLQYRNPPMITLYECGEFADAGLGVMAPRTGAVPVFRILAYKPGFVIQFPQWDREEKKLFLPDFEKQAHLFQVFQEHKQWGRVIGVNTVGDLNRLVAEKKEKAFIRISETRHEKHLGDIADRIARHHDQLKWILIAGPSSAGKTTSSKRLMVHLQVNGLRPVRLELDNYFRERKYTPKHPDGSYDFEHIDTIDLELLNEHLTQLDRGEEIALPTFNFLEGRPEFLGNTLKLEEDQVVVIEGIHALNPLLTAQLPSSHKFKVYINALTQLKLDNHNRLSTTDLRLIRRIIRDFNHRGHNAKQTLSMWPSVRGGEKRWIFPFQQEADVTFNSSLDYELAVLKPYAEPLLHSVKPTDDVYGEARRLQDFLAMIVGTPQDQVPPHSLLREFIGGSIYEKDH
ncbi:nucleoside kinase [Kiritimatiellota bacterium B12222]|nr:nucleoside kinase [Kiritimatiellota bacterium B12222]